VTAAPAPKPRASVARPPGLTRRRIGRVHALLLEHYGERLPTVRDPLDGLILIILSQATNDVNCDRAFSSLREHFPTWEQVRKAPVDDIADAIRAGGLANQKAARIKQILQEIHEESGALNLSWMHTASAEEVRAYLSKFHGVGPKTIACVLVFFLDKPAFPVDTHVHRVTKRLGWVREKSSPEEAHRVLEAAVPDEWKLNLHVNLIVLGRTLCRADGNGGPQCGACFLRRNCDYGRQADVKTLSSGAKPRNSNPDFFVTVEPKHKETHGIR
jgi:endonuclease-3